MRRFPSDWSDALASVFLLVLGTSIVMLKPFGVGISEAATLAGALYGSAAILFGAWLNRLSDLKRSADQMAQKRETLVALITAEYVNLSVGLLQAKQLLDVALEASAAGHSAGPVNLADIEPRPTPYVDALVAEMLVFDKPIVDAIVTLRSSLHLTRDALIKNREHAIGQRGLSFLAWKALAAGVGFDMGLLSEVLEKLAPTRQIAIGDGPARTLFELLKEKSTLAY